MKQTGKLNREQFALALYLIQLKLRGAELPAALTAEMVPPTMRPKPGQDPTPPPPQVSQSGRLPRRGGVHGNREADGIIWEARQTPSRATPNGWEREAARAELTSGGRGLVESGEEGAICVILFGDDLLSGLCECVVAWEHECKRPYRGVFARF